MAHIDLSGPSIDRLTGLVGKAQSERASRERQRNMDLRSELEWRIDARPAWRRVAASPLFSLVPSDGAPRATPPSTCRIDAVAGGGMRMWSRYTYM